MSKKVNKNHILAILALAQFMVVLDISIINVAIPAINSDLNFNPSDLQWVVTAYTLTFGGFLLLGGRAADLFGRRRVFLGGTLLFTLASLLGGFAQSDTMLIAFRALQGLGAGFMSPAALSIVVNTFKEGPERNRALGVWGGIAAGGAAAGLLLGGVLTEYLGWRWDFFVNVPIGLAVAFLAPRIVPESKAGLKHQHLDMPGAVLATAGLMTLVFTLVKAPVYHWTDIKTIALFALSFALLAGFIFNELRSKQPLMPLNILKNHNLRGGNLVQLPIAASMFAMFFFLSIYLQNILNFSPIQTGLGFLPVAVVIGIASAVVAKLVTKVGFKLPMMIAPLFLGAGLVYFSQMPAVGGSYLTDVLPGLIIMALGLGFSFVSVTIAATSGVPHDKAGLASGILNTSQQIGGSLGLAILTGVFTAGLTSSMATGANPSTAQVAGFHDAFLVAAGFAVLAAVMAALFVKQGRQKVPDTAVPVVSKA